MVSDYSAAAWAEASAQEEAEEEMMRLSSLAQPAQVTLPDEVVRFLNGEDLDEEDEPRCPDVDYSDEQLLDIRY